MLAGRYQISWNQIDMFFPPQNLSSNVIGASLQHNDAVPQLHSIPVDTTKWSWGAFSLYPLWGFFNGCWWAFFACFIGWSLIPSILFGVYGRRLAWENRKWTSPQDFLDAQRSWDTWGIIMFVISIVFVLFFSIFLIGIWSSLVV